MIKKVFAFMLVGVACTAISLAGAVTNTIDWRVPWGDTWRDKAIGVLGAYETEINLLASGSDIILASNQVFIGSALGKAYPRSLSGLFTITTNGVASATSSGLAWTNATASVTVSIGAPALTNVATATTVDCLGDVIPSLSAAVTGVATTASAFLTGATENPATVMTNFAIQSTMNCITGLATTANSLILTNVTAATVAAVTGVATTANSLVLTNVTVAALSGIVTNYTSTTILPVTNVLYTTVAVVTNITWTETTYTNANFDVTNVFVVYSSPVAQTLNVNAISSLETATALDSITLQACNMTPVLTLETGEAIASVTPTTENVSGNLTLETGSALATIVASSTGLPLTFNPQTTTVVGSLTLADANAITVVTPTTSDFVDGVTSNVVTPINSLILQTGAITATSTLTPATGTFVKP